jgi:hypothetical protein
MQTIVEQFKQHIYDGLLDPTNHKYTFMKIDSEQESLINANGGIKKIFEDCFGNQSFSFIGNCIFISKWSAQGQKFNDEQKDKCIVTPMLRIKKGLSIYDTEYVTKLAPLSQTKTSEQKIQEFNELWLRYQKNPDVHLISTLKEKLDEILTI